MKSVFSLFALFLLSSGVLFSTEYFVNGSTPHAQQDGSQAYPFKTIQQAIKAPAEGAKTITVADGIYREQVFIMRKRDEHALHIRAAAGTRPIISGFRSDLVWTKGQDGLYHAIADFRPKSLLIDGVYMPVARYPESGWLPMEYIGKDTFKATTPQALMPGTTCYVWYARGNVFASLKILPTSPKGAYTVESCRLGQSNKNHFFALNHPSLARKSGQWGWIQRGKKEYELFLRLDKAPSSCTIDVGGALKTVYIRDSNQVALEGFTIMGSGDDGLFLGGSTNIKLNRIGVFLNAGCGAWIRGCKGVTLEDCRIACNQGGIACMYNQDVVIRKCDVSYNFEDGITITWKTQNALVEGCRIHHHNWWGHPDGIQLYRHANNVTIRNNVLFANGQCIMTEDLDHVVFQNNLMVGSKGMMLIWGHNSTNDVKMTDNTLLTSNFASMAITGKNYELSNNVISGFFFGKDADLSYKGRNNLFISSSKGWNKKVRGERCTTFARYTELVDEKDSLVQQEPVPGIPSFLAGIGSVTLWQCTEDTVVIGQGRAKGFKPNDIIEISFDGIPRTVTAVKGDSVSFTPPLAYRPIHGNTVFNWGTNKDMAWNPQLIRKNGSSLSYDLIRQDIITTVPMPKLVKAFIGNVGKLLPPHRF